jgi:hypothetical protein
MTESASEVTQAVTRYLASLPYTYMKAKEAQVNFLVVRDATTDLMQILPYTGTPHEPTREAVSSVVHHRLSEHGISMDPRDLPKRKDNYTVGDLSKPDQAGAQS